MKSIGAQSLAVDSIPARPLLRKQRPSPDTPVAFWQSAEFLAVLSHELRNAIAPMASALQYLRLTEQTNGAGPNKTHLLLERQVALMSYLVSDLQEVSTGGATQVHFRPSAIDLRPVVTRSVQAVMSVFAHRRHHVSVALLDEPIWVEADPVRIEQVVVNLVNNAAKYTPDGGSISISARRAHGQAELRVADNGMGIPSEMLQQVFTLFVRTETARVHSRAGVGIGLNVVKRIVEHHGGSVVANSDGAGKGSEFVVSLPLTPYAG